MSSFLPIDFVLMDTRGELHREWKKHFATLPEPIQARFTFVESRLDDLPSPHNKFDCIVSPANSYGIMDGAFDYALSQAFKPPGGDFFALSRQVQKSLYRTHLGYLPPGNCSIVDLRGTELANNKYGAFALAVLPTMRTPEVVTWDKDLVYNCMWNLLIELAKLCPEEPPPPYSEQDDNWQRTESQLRRSSGPQIRKLVMTGLATGVGRISAERCASQMMFAVKHFSEARSAPERWSKVDWEDVYKRDAEIEQTRNR